jgi:hypothetical protein
MSLEIRFTNFDAAEFFADAANGLCDDNDPRLADMGILCDAIEISLKRHRAGELVAIVPARIRDLAEIVAKICMTAPRGRWRNRQLPIAHYEISIS